MAKDVPSTSEHRSPARPSGLSERPALVCAFPRPVALPLPPSGTVVGRAWLEEHGVPDTEVSTAHVRIDRRGGVLRVADDGSRNGTWVNGQKLAPRDLTPLEDGAVLRLGCTLLVFREALRGGNEPAPALGGLIGPFGLRDVTSLVASFGREPPRNVLIEGETGVGKELVARAVAAACARDRTFAPVNVAGIARGVFESHMFGHVAGAFSDARTAAPGIVVAHDGGTLFLDEIGELDLDLQAKLLRLVENREVLAVGASRARTVDVLLLAATNRDLGALVEAGTFRRDLFARLASTRLVVPPLRERREDVFPLVMELQRRRARPLSVAHVEVEAVERLCLEDWATNVRGLDAALTAIGRVDPEPGLRRWAVDKVLGATQPGSALTGTMVEGALVAARGNVTEAAARLGVSRGKLLRFRKKSGAP